MHDGFGLIRTIRNGIFVGHSELDDILLRARMCVLSCACMSVNKYACLREREKEKER